MPYDRIGNPGTGRGDGITAFQTSGYPTLAYFDSSIWDLSGSVPLLRWEASID